MNQTKIFLGIALLFILSNAFGQQTLGSERIRIDLTNRSFEQVVKEIESTTSYRFFYRPSDVDSLQVNLGMKNGNVPDILKEVFATGDLHFAIDPERNVFITKDKEIFTELLYDPSSGDFSGARDVAKL